MRCTLSELASKAIVVVFGQRDADAVHDGGGGYRGVSVT